MDLVQTFLPHAGPARAKLEDVPDLESILERVVSAAASAWPDLSIARDDFLAYLAQKLSSNEDPAGTLASVHIPDLYLTFACSRGDAKALALFDKRFLDGAAISTSHADASFNDELRQRLRSRLFIASTGAPAKITTYSGRGQLGTWLHTVASRMAIDMHTENKQHQSADGDDVEIQAPGLDPELDYLKTLYGGEIKQAFRATLESLPLQESNILRLHFLDGMTVDALSGVYRTSKRTMARRIASARDLVLTETKRLLAHRINLPASQVNTLMAIAQSQMHSVVEDFFENPKKT